MARRKTRLKAPLPLGSILANAPIARRTGRLVELFRVRRVWDHCVGEVLAKRTFPKRLYRDVLVVAVESPAWAQQLTMLKEEVLRQLTDRTEITFSDIRFVNESFKKPETKPKPSAPKPDAPLSASPVEGIKDSELAELLGRVRARLHRLRDD